MPIQKGAVKVKLKKLPLLLGTIFIISILSSVNAHAYTRSYLSEEYKNTPLGPTMLTDYESYGNKLYNLKDAEDRSSINSAGDAKVDKWKSDIEYVIQAPELEVYFEGQMPTGTEFEVRLINLTWFFRNSGDDRFLPITTDNYTGGIESLFPTSYNKYKGKYMPSDYSGIGGTYSRERENEVPYLLIVDENDPSVARVVLLSDTYGRSSLIIPIVSRLVSYGDARVEIVPTKSASISPGSHTILLADREVQRNANQKNATVTTVPNPQSGIAEIPIPEIVISENAHGIIRDGSIMLTAPEGFAILPDVDNEKLKNIGHQTLDIKDNHGNYIVNATLGGGLKWKSTYHNPHQDDPFRNTDIRFYYRNPPGNMDTSRFIVEFKNLINSSELNLGSVTITGLKLVPLTNDNAPGDLYINISSFANMSGLITEDFIAGIFEGGSSGSDYMNSFNIDAMPLADLIKTPEFKAKTYISHAGGKLQPTLTITRGQLCEMVYTLLADTNKSYTHSFKDVEGSVYENAIAFCFENGYINGYGDGTFLPNGNIKRGEFAVILNNILKLSANTTVEFEDKNHFAYEAIKQLVHAKIMQGYGNNELGQENLINKQEAVAMINRAFGRGNSFTPNGVLYDDLPTTLWSYGDMMNAACGHITK